MGTILYFIMWIAIGVVAFIVFLILMGILFWLALAGLTWMAEKFLKKGENGEHVAGVDYEGQD